MDKHSGLRVEYCEYFRAVPILPLTDEYSGPTQEVTKDTFVTLQGVGKTSRFGKTCFATSGLFTVPHLKYPHMFVADVAIKLAGKTITNATRRHVRRMTSGEADWNMLCMIISSNDQLPRISFSQAKFVTELFVS